MAQVMSDVIARNPSSFKKNDELGLSRPQLGGAQPVVPEGWVPSPTRPMPVLTEDEMKFILNWKPKRDLTETERLMLQVAESNARLPKKKHPSFPMRGTSSRAPSPTQDQIPLPPPQSRATPKALTETERLMQKVAESNARLPKKKHPSFPMRGTPRAETARLPKKLPPPKGWVPAIGTKFN
jgi:hypothetical protein